MRVCYKPIGFVARGLPPRGPRPASKLEVEGEVIVYPEYRAALEGIDGYSHVILVSHLHRAEPALVVDASRQGAPGPLGALATRGPRRPNPIGLSIVELLEADPALGVLRVSGIDLYPGTPILDVKPYDLLDIVPCPRVPGWLRERWMEKRSIYDAHGWPGPLYWECPR